MRAVPKFLLFRIPGSGYLGEVSIGSAKRSTFGKAPLVTALPYDIIGPVARKSPPTTRLNCRAPLFHSLSLFHPRPISLSFLLFLSFSSFRAEIIIYLPSTSSIMLFPFRLSLLPSLRSDFLSLSLFSLTLSRSTLYAFLFFFSPSIRSTPPPLLRVKRLHATLSVASFCSCFPRFSKPFSFSETAPPPFSNLRPFHLSIALFLSFVSASRSHAVITEEEDRRSFVESTIRITRSSRDVGLDRLDLDP